MGSWEGTKGQRGVGDRTTLDSIGGRQSAGVWMYGVWLSDALPGIILGPLPGCIGAVVTKGAARNRCRQAVRQK
jgi:hypothetical protein